MRDLSVTQLAHPLRSGDLTAEQPRPPAAAQV